MKKTLPIRDLTSEEFAPFGDVLEIAGDPDKIINQGMCGRYHDIANITCDEGRMGISLFDAKPRSLPLSLDLMERHPMGSQAFVPMHQHPYLVIVAQDDNGSPDTPKVFLASNGVGVNYHKNIWHAVLTPLEPTGPFAVIDRIRSGENLEEFGFEIPWDIEPI